MYKVTNGLLPLEAGITWTEGALEAHKAGTARGIDGRTITMLRPPVEADRISCTSIRLHDPFVSAVMPRC